MRLSKQLFKLFVFFCLFVLSVFRTAAQSPQIPTFLPSSQMVYVDGIQYTTLAQALAAIPTGGKVILPCGIFTIPATVTLTDLSGPVVIEGCGMGNSTSGGTRLVATSGSVTPILKIQGTTAGARAGNIFLRDLTIQGVYTTSQTCLTIDHATYIVQDHVQYANCGQAEWDNDVYRSIHDDTTYFQSGSGGTNTTATVRVENTSNPGVASEQIFFLNCVWQGNLGSMQGTAVYFGPATQEERIIASKLDYFSADPPFPLIYINQANTIDISNNTISGYSATSPALGVIYVTGTSGTHSSQVHINNNTTVSFSNAVPAVYLDYVTNYEILGGTFQGNGSGTAIVTTAHTFGGGIGPFRMVSADTPVNDVSGLAGIIYSDPNTGQIDIRSPLNINQPQTNTSTIAAVGITDTSAATKMKRPYYNQGTALTTSNAALSTSPGWGSSPSFTIAGYDPVFSVAVTSGSGSPGVNPNVVLTFADGAWADGNPVCLVSRGDGVSPSTGYWEVTSTTTQATMTFVGTPGTATTYTVDVTCTGR